MGDRGAASDGPPDEIVTAATGRAGPVDIFPGGGAERYVFIEQLGAGGMGTVMRAYDSKLQREVALKQLHPHALCSTGEARLLQEAQAMAKLSHPNVVAVYDVLLDGLPSGPTQDSGGTVTVAMELVDGRTLKVWLAAEPRTPSEVIDVFARAGRGLAAAHHASLVHRDFKPANVLLGCAGEVKVTDFGLAKSVGEQSLGSAHESDRGGQSELAADTGLTKTGVVMGTTRYMAPEQHAGRPTTAASDQYAFCVALWEGLAGGPPFSGAELAQAKHRGPPMWPTSASHVPSRVVDVLRRGLSPNPDTRWPSMEALLDALVPKARRATRWTSVAVGTALVGGTALWLHDLSERRSHVCTGARDQIALTWNDDLRARIESAMLRTGATFAPHSWEQVEPRSDDYATAWTRQHIAACEATNLLHQQSAEDLDLRVACLDRARRALAETTEVLARSDARVVQRAVEVVEGLPSVARCADVEALRAEVPPPEDAAVASEVAQIRAVLARARGLRRAGLYPAALELSLDAVPRAASTKYGPIVAEALGSRGRSYVELARYEEAEADLRHGMRRALSARMTDLAASSSSWLTLLVGYRLARPDEGVHLGRIAVALSKATRSRSGCASTSHLHRFGPRRGLRGPTPGEGGRLLVGGDGPPATQMLTVLEQWRSQHGV